MATRQLLTRIWDKTHAKFSKQMDEVALKRDAFLDRVLDHEAKQVLREIPKPNSKLAHGFLLRKVRELDSTKVNLTLSLRTFELIDKACTEKNIPRDCFINRVILMLVAGRRFYAQLLEDDEFDSYVLDPDNREEFYGGFHLSSLDAIGSVVNDDPFRPIRYLIKYANQQRARDLNPLLAIPVTPVMFNSHPPPEALYGLNCWLPDDYVPGTAAHKKQQRHFDQLGSEMFGAEPATQRRRRKK